MAKGDARVKITLDDQFSKGIKRIQQSLVRAQAVFDKTRLKIVIDNKSALGKLDFIKKQKLQQLQTAFSSNPIKIEIDNKSALGKINRLKGEKLTELKQAYQNNPIKVVFDTATGFTQASNAIKSIADKGKDLPKIKVNIDAVDPKRLDSLKEAASALRSITAAPKRASKAPNVDKTLKTLEGFIPKLQEFSTQIKASMAEVNAALKTLDPSKLKELAGILKTARKNADRILLSLKALGGAAKIVSQAEFELEKKLKRANKEKEEAAKKAKKASLAFRGFRAAAIAIIGRIPVLRTSLKLLGKGFGNAIKPTLITRLRAIRFAFVDLSSVARAFGLTRVINQFKETIKLAAEVELKTARIATLLQGQGGAGNIAVGFDFTDPASRDAALAQLSTDIRNVAAEGGQSFESAFQAAYDAISAGVPATRLLDFLREANKLAIGGVTDLGTATKLLVSVFQTTGREIDKLPEQVDSLFTTIRLGRTTADELAGSLGRVLPVAESVGIGLDELGGALAALSTGGLSTAEAVTALRNVLQKILRPTGSSLEVARELVTELGTPGLRENDGLAGYLSELALRAGDNADALAELFPRIRANIGILSLLRNEGGALDDFFIPFSTKAGSAAKAVELITDTASFSFQKLKVNLQDLGVELAQNLIPTFKEFLTNVLTPIERIVDNLRGLQSQGRDAILRIQSARDQELITPADAQRRIADVERAVSQGRGGVIQESLGVLKRAFIAGGEVIKAKFLTAASQFGFEALSVSGILGETFIFFIEEFTFAFLSAGTDLINGLAQQFGFSNLLTPPDRSRQLSARQAAERAAFIGQSITTGPGPIVGAADNLLQGVPDRGFVARDDLNKAIELLREIAELGQRERVGTSGNQFPILDDDLSIFAFANNAQKVADRLAEIDQQLAREEITRQQLGSIPDAGEQQRQLRNFDALLVDLRDERREIQETIRKSRRSFLTEAGGSTFRIGVGTGDLDGFNTAFAKLKRTLEDVQKRFGELPDEVVRTQRGLNLADLLNQFQDGNLLSLIQNQGSATTPFLAIRDLERKILELEAAPFLNRDLLRAGEQAAQDDLTARNAARESAAVDELKKIGTAVRDIGVTTRSIETIDRATQGLPQRQTPSAPGITFLQRQDIFANRRSIPGTAASRLSQLAITQQQQNAILDELVLNLQKIEDQSDLANASFEDGEAILKDQEEALKKALVVGEQLQLFEEERVGDIQLQLNGQTEILGVKQEIRKFDIEIEQLEKQQGVFAQEKAKRLKEVLTLLGQQKLEEAKIAEFSRQRAFNAQALQTILEGLTIGAGLDAPQVDLRQAPIINRGSELIGGATIDTKFLNERAKFLRQQVEEINNLIIEQQNLARTGELTAFAASQNINKLNEELNATSKEIAQIERLAFASLGPLQAMEVALVQRFQDVPLVLETLATAAGDLIEGVAQGFAQLTTNVITDLINGTKSAEDAFRQFFGQLLIQIGQAIIQALILRVILTALGLPTAGGFNSGGPVVSRNTGGPVPGARGPDRDSVPAVLTPGEFVVRRSAVDKIGLPFLMALNNVGRAPSGFKGRTTPQVAGVSPMRFNMGGAVPAGAGASGAQPSYLLANESNAQAFLQGGRNQFISFLRENRNKF